MPPKPKLHPVDPSILILHVGDRVAFTETHSVHPGMYGIIEGIGLTPTGGVAFDLNVIDPATGEQSGKSKTVYRAGMEDIQ